MNSDIAHAAASTLDLFERRHRDEPQWCFAHQGWVDGEKFGIGRCWDCTFAAKRKAAAELAWDLLKAGERAAALLVLADSVNAQAAREGLGPGAVIDVELVAA